MSASNSVIDVSLSVPTEGGSPVNLVLCAAHAQTRNAKAALEAEDGIAAEADLAIESAIWGLRRKAFAAFVGRWSRAVWR
jgi:hypothetical protein